MKVALPVFRDRVSPVFDWSTRLVVIETDGRREKNREEGDMNGMSPLARANLLADMAVDTLLCGGISGYMLTLLESRKIRVIPWIAGEVEQVMCAFLEERIPGRGFLMPGCCDGRGRRRRRGRGGPGNAPESRKE